MKSKCSKQHIFASTGEISGEDLLLGTFLEYQKLLPKCCIAWKAIGSNRLHDFGIQTTFDFSHRNTIGIPKNILNIPFALHWLFKLKTQFQYNPPTLVLLIDHPGFNLLLGKMTLSLNIPTWYWFPPSPTLSKFWNANKIIYRANALFCPFKQDVRIYKKFAQPNQRITWTGHPDQHFGINEEKHQISNPPLCVGLFPGSRRSEINILAPIFLRLAKDILNETNVYFKLWTPKQHQERIKHIFNNIFSSSSKQNNVKIINRDENSNFVQCRFAIACSGSITLQLALAGIPMIVTYVLDRWSLLVFKPKLLEQRIAIPNILLSKSIFPEIYGHEIKKIETRLRKTFTSHFDSKIFKNKTIKYRKILLHELKMNNNPSRVMAKAIHGKVHSQLCKQKNRTVFHC